MGVVCRGWIWLKRFRFRRGYGVHSPFAFDFLTYVVYEKGEYYAYRALKELYKPSFFAADGRHLLKCRKFLFRLSNYVHPGTIRLHGVVGKEVADYLSAGCASAVLCRGQETVCPVRDGELVYVSEDVPCHEWKALVSQPQSERSVSILCGIHASGESGACWEKLKALPSVIVSFDLYDYGLLFYDTSKQRQHYMVNF